MPEENTETSLTRNGFWTGEALWFVRLTKCYYGWSNKEEWNWQVNVARVGDRRVAYRVLVVETWRKENTWKNVLYWQCSRQFIGHRRSFSVACFNNGESAAYNCVSRTVVTFGLASRELAMISFILDAFSKFRKATISFVMFVRLNACYCAWTQRGSHWTDFNEIWYWVFFS